MSSDLIGQGAAFPTPIFVGGLQRSGTTLLARLLASHSQATGLSGTPTPEDEGQFVQDVFLDDHQMGAQGWRHSGRSMKWAYHPEAHLVAADAVDRPQAAERLQESWGQYLSDASAQYFVEKSPSNVMRTLFLQEVFPQAKFIIITRHPVVQALAVRKWGTLRMRAGLDLGRIIEHWLTAMECFREDAPLLRNAEIVTYEDLVARPAQTMRAVHKFIGLDDEPLPLNDIADRSTPYFDYWKSLSQSRFHAMRMPQSGSREVKEFILAVAERCMTGAFGSRTVAAIGRRYGERIARFGYRLDDLASAGPWR